MIKGEANILRGKIGKKLIVKSCSNLRSKVVDESVFSKWDAKRLSYLPVYFRKKIQGKDIRVYLCGHCVWELEIYGKDIADYRDASKDLVKYKQTKIPTFVRDFVRNISEVEKNDLIGVDFLRTGGTITA